MTPPQVLVTPDHTCLHHNSSLTCKACDTSLSRTLFMSGMVVAQPSQLANGHGLKRAQRTIKSTQSLSLNNI